MLQRGRFGDEQATEVGESTRARGLHGEMMAVVVVMIVVVVMVIVVVMVMIVVALGA